MRNFSYLMLTALLSIFAACGGGGSDHSTNTASASTGKQPPTQTDFCATTAGQNTFVYNTMKDWYYWYQDIPSIDPSHYASQQSLLDAIEYKPRDRFTFINSKKAEDAFYNQDHYTGIGIGTKLVAAHQYRVTDTFAGSPAAKAGLVRGDRILTINGRTISDLQQSGDLAAALTTKKGGTVSLTWRDTAGADHDATVTATTVTEPSVAHTEVLDVNGGKVAYLAFRNFTTPADAELNKAFKKFAAQGANRLVLDERYNGGGLLSVAQHLASLIGGSNTTDRSFATLTYNNKHSNENQTFSFAHEKSALSLDSLVVITTGATASASELIINGLKPYISVATVGATTFGKPVASNGFDFCGKVLHPITAKIKNAAGAGDYFDGFAPTCPANDDLDHPLGSTDEASLATALHYLKTGRCGGASQSSARYTAAIQAAQPVASRHYSFKNLINAH